MHTESLLLRVNKEMTTAVSPDTGLEEEPEPTRHVQPMKDAMLRSGLLKEGDAPQDGAVMVRGKVGASGEKARWQKPPDPKRRPLFARAMPRPPTQPSPPRPAPPQASLHKAAPGPPRRPARDPLAWQALCARGGEGLSPPPASPVCPHPQKPA